MCCCQMIENTLSFGLEQRTNSQVDYKWNMPSHARSQRIKLASSLEIDTNKIYLTIERGKTSSNLSLSQTIPCQKKETYTEEAAVGL